MPTNTIHLTTDSIDERGFFDPRYTCDLDNSSPELRWTDPPAETAGFAVVMEDHQNPTAIFAHWVIYNIPKNIRHLPAGIPPQETLPNGIRQGLNDFGKLGYAGPCPPMRDGAHPYVFKIFALRMLPELPNRSNRAQLLAGIMPHIVTSAEIRGKYQRVIQKAG